MSRKRKIHLRDWGHHKITIALTNVAGMIAGNNYQTPRYARTKCGIEDDWIPKRDDNATREGELKGIAKIPREELCKNCMATLHN